MRALSPCTSLGNSESKPRLQPQSEERQRLRQSVPARRDGTAEARLCSPAGGRMGRQGARADSESPTCEECRLCGQPCQRVCWIDSCSRTTATCYEITGRTCTQPLHHQGPHRCGTCHEDAVGRGNCDDEEGSDDSGCDGEDDDYKSRKGKGRDKDKQRVAVRRE